MFAFVLAVGEVVLQLGRSPFAGYFFAAASKI
jgi:hypothetical protein